MEAGSGLELSDFPGLQSVTPQSLDTAKPSRALCAYFPLSRLPPIFFLRQGFFPAFLASFWGIGQAPAYWLEMNELQGANELRR